MSDWNVVIPARYASTRLPGKALLEIGGAPMIVHTCRRAAASGAREVVVATDDQRIVDAVERVGFRAVMTDPELPSGTDRMHAVATQLGWPAETIAVNVQGDEPAIPPAVIDQAAGLLHSDPGADAATLAEVITNPEDLAQPAVVKVVVSNQGRALYFSRAPVPWQRDAFPPGPDLDLQAFPWRRHIGIYAYRVATLERFVGFEPAAIEEIEKLEQLRLLANGLSMAVAEACEEVPAGVDTPEDLERMRAVLDAAGDSSAGL